MVFLIARFGTGLEMAIKMLYIIFSNSIRACCTNMAINSPLIINRLKTVSKKCSSPYGKRETPSVTFRRKLIKELSGNHIIIKNNFEIANYSFCLEASQEEEIIKKETEKELISKVTRHLSKLSKKKREVVYLRYYCELDYDQVAAVMDISYQSARNLMYKALKTLKEQLTSSPLSLFITLFTFF